jgi:thioesterase domain-containing protein
VLVPIRPHGRRTPFFCVHGRGGNVVGQRDLARLLGDDQPFYGVQAAALHEQPPRFRSIEDIAAHYVAALRAVQPAGPYALGGICFGGLVAFEMARQLRDAGQQVGLLALIGPPLPVSRPRHVRQASRVATGRSWRHASASAACTVAPSPGTAPGRTPAGRCCSTRRNRTARNSRPCEARPGPGSWRAASSAIPSTATTA